MASSSDHQPRLAQALVPDDPTLADLVAAAAGCQACDLWRMGTQTVFGYGHSDADMVLVGEQPGDREDREGKPFVGPSGQLLDRALEAAGIDRRQTYATNVVKSPLAPNVLATVHPSSILRTHDQQRQVALQGLIDDLAVAATVLP